jgi:hypothetical protein
MYMEGTTGALTSVASPGTATTIDTRGFRTGLIAIKNTGVTNTLQYKIDGYANYSGVAGPIADVTIADIAPEATVTFPFVNVTRGKFVVTITPKVVGDQSTYVIEHCMGL